MSDINSIERKETIKKIIEKHGTPCYIYFYEDIVKNIERFKSQIPFPIRLFFPVMTNDNPNIIKLMYQQGLDIFVNTISHFEVIYKAGIPLYRINFTSSNCDSSVFEVLQKISIHFNANSISQAMKYLHITHRKTLGVRVNLSTLLGIYDIDKQYRDKLIPYDRIGIDAKELKGILNANHPLSTAIVGLHIYPGTNLSNAHFLVYCYKCLVELVKEFKQIKYLNFGGGFPIYSENTKSDFDWQYLYEELKRIYEIIRNETAVNEIQFEPGRTIVGNTAIFVTEITDIYDLGRTHYIGTDACINIFPRPFYYKDAYLQHPVSLLEDNIGKNIGTYVVCGESTFSADVLSPSATLKNPKIGDHLIFSNAGAYCSSMRNSFLSSAIPSEILVKGEIFRRIGGEARHILTRKILKSTKRR